ncbi:MAG: hypothetical protein VB108_10010 [Anaerolineaceae bacterium]|nr:hypothetical protein [Anaerolineaceae bacterium]
MKRKIISLLILSLLIGLVLTACSSAQKGSGTAANTPVSTSYPLQQEGTKTETIPSAYPVAEATQGAVSSSGKMTNEQVLALIEKQMNGHHTVDFLLTQKLTHDQWVDVLNKPEHNEVIFTADELEQVIAYLIAHQK